MKKIVLLIIAATLIIAAAMTLSSCKNWDNPYEAIDKKGDAIKICYLANGGRFAQEETAVLYDVYRLSNVKEENGKKAVSLIAPEDDRRSLAGGKGNKDFIVHKDPKSYKLAGWGIVETDDNGTPILDSNGNYKIVGTWDFENDVISIDSTKSYSSKTPILTLAAIWTSYYSFEFYMQNESGEWVVIENATQSNINTLLFPVWKNGKLDMEDYPTVSGKTFSKAYEDPEMTVEITADITPAPSSEGDNVKKIYTTWEDGNWYRITEGNQIYDINDLKGNYIIMNDLLVSKWRSAFYTGTFTGQILSDKAVGIEGGQDRKISGITTSSIAANKSNRSVGLFGKIGASAKICGITFDSITVKFQSSAADITERYYGLLAGTVEEGATFSDVKITNSKIVFTTDTYNNNFFSTFFNAGADTTTNIINLVADGNIEGIEFTNTDITYEITEGLAMSFGVEIAIDTNGTFTVTKKQS